mmetsp:Transcript_21313/g.63864  ORF Transcript_21313/g.63864 Transcript_21313/m.63864 type:complete len:99 (+) Transcript_21313:773-1069(+)
MLPAAEAGPALDKGTAAPAPAVASAASIVPPPPPRRPASGKLLAGVRQRRPQNSKMRRKATPRTNGAVIKGACLSGRRGSGRGQWLLRTFLCFGLGSE